MRPDYSLYACDGMMGELVALAASLCKKYNCSPREVYKNHLKELESKIK